jgi:hypothetical protein
MPVVGVEPTMIQDYSKIVIKLKSLIPESLTFVCRSVAQTLLKLMHCNRLDIQGRSGDGIMNVATIYKPLGQDSPEETYFYMMNCLLYSRVESGFHSNDGYLDEDVNVYLANLLTETVGSGSGDREAGPLACDDISLFQRVRTIDNPRQKYMLYKAHADNLLISLGIFGNPKGSRANSTPYMAMSENSYIGRGKSYYSLAQSYAVETHRRHTAVADVLGKLSRGFEKYVKVLARLRSDYFNFHHHMTEGELFHLECSLDIEEHKEELKKLYDIFLDLYSSYRKKKRAGLKKKLDEVSSRIRALDPSFNFQCE